MMFGEVGAFAEREDAAENMRGVLACADNLPPSVCFK